MRDTSGLLVRESVISGVRAKGGGIVGATAKGGVTTGGIGVVSAPTSGRPRNNGLGAFRKRKIYFYFIVVAVVVVVVVVSVVVIEVVGDVSVRVLTDVCEVFSSWILSLLSEFCEEEIFLPSLQKTFCRLHLGSGSGKT